MATTVKQDREFSESLFDGSKLQEAIDWIQDHLEPEEVFTDSQLEAWAERAGFEKGQES
jgi:hypothetical protein